MKQMYKLKNLVTLSELWISNLFSKSNFVSTISNRQLLIKKLKVAPKKKFRDPPLAAPPWSPWPYNFFRKTYFMYKKPQLSIKKMVPITSKSKGESTVAPRYRVWHLYIWLVIQDRIHCTILVTYPQGKH